METLKEIALAPVFGKPAILIGGMTVATLFLVTAALGFLMMKGKIRMSIKLHQGIALVAIVLGFFHGMLGLALLW